MAPAGVGGRLGQVPGHEYAFHPLDQGAEFVVVLRGVEQHDEGRELPLLRPIAVHAPCVFRFLLNGLLAAR
ncbi:hypothetical protein [Streptomyces virginiae]|uniref:hypothetical protein n=1 Tax=Streptomyces virginiae TaxID=1961 RepID=UPI0036FCBBF0